MRRSRPNGIAATRGFTLLELLVATAIGAIVLIVIQTTFFSALRLQNTTHQRIDEDAALYRALGIVRRDFAGLMLPGGTFSGQFQTENFSSMGSENYGERVSPDLFTNSGRIDAYNPFGDVQMVAYYLAAPASTMTEGAGPKGSNLVRVVTRNLLPVQETSAADVDQQVLLQGVDTASVSFYDGTSWVDVWDSTVTSTLPRALRFSLVMVPPDGNQASAPIEVVVPVPAMTTASQQEEQEAANP